MGFRIILFFTFLGCSFSQEETKQIVEQEKPKPTKENFHLDEILENLVISKKIPKIVNCASKRKSAMEKLGIKISKLQFRELERACIYLTKYYQFGELNGEEIKKPKQKTKPLTEEDYRQMQLGKSKKKWEENQNESERSERGNKIEDEASN